MRISDWSSDVCSSDLPGCSATKSTWVMNTASSAERDDGAPSTARSTRASKRSATQESTACRIASLVGKCRNSEIGRASCRERVWQYVWNAGGAGTLKKRANHNKQNTNEQHKKE